MTHSSWTKVFDSTTSPIDTIFCGWVTNPPPTSGNQHLTFSYGFLAEYLSISALYDPSAGTEDFVYFGGRIIGADGTSVGTGYVGDALLSPRNLADDLDGYPGV